jgi:uncharacterized delta-60 repeat protein
MKHLYFLTTIFSFFFVNSQNIDVTYNPNHSGPFDEYMGDFGLTLGDKILTYYKYDDQGSNSIRIYNNDGSLFNEVLNNSNYYIENKMYQQKNGSIIFFTRYYSDFDTLYYNKINPDFSVEGPFQLPSLTYSTAGLIIRDLLLQDDGKLIFIADFTAVNSINKYKIVRLNSDFSVDLTFDVGNYNSNINTIKVLDNGKYLIGGSFTDLNNTNRKTIARLNQDGSIDTTFYNYSSSPGLSGEVTSIVIQSDDKILINSQYGTFNIFNNYFTPITKITRLNSNGTRDASFTSAEYGEGLTLLPNNQIIFNSIDTSYKRKIKKLNSNGSLDTSFIVSNNFTGSITKGVQQLTNGKFLINSNYNTTDSGIQRNKIYVINPDNSIDLTFNPQQSINCDKYLLKVINNNKIFLLGKTRDDINWPSAVTTNLTSYNENSCKSAIITSENGEYENDFILDSQVKFNLTNLTYKPGEIIQCNDNKIYISELNHNSDLFIYVNNVEKKIIRLNVDGSLDNTFNFDDTSVFGIYGIEALPDGRLLVIMRLYGNNYTRTYRLNYDGTIDSSYIPYTSTIYGNPNPSYITKFKDDTYFLRIAGGGGIPTIVKLLADGTIDNTFQSISHGEKIRKFSNGKYLIEKENFNDSVDLLRLNSDGTLDSTFNLINISEPNVQTNISFKLFIDSNDNIIRISDGWNYSTSSTNKTYNIYSSNGTLLESNPWNHNNIIDLYQQGCDKLVAHSIDGKDIVRLNLSNTYTVPSPNGNTIQPFVPNSTLANLNVIGQNIQWYSTQSVCYNSNILAKNQLYFSPLPSSTIVVDGETYYASQTINGVESNYRLPVKVSSTLENKHFENNNFTIINPVYDNLEIYSHIDIAKIEIFNLLGSRLVVKQINENNKNLKIDMSYLVSNVYILKLHTAIGIFTKKIIKK